MQRELGIARCGLACCLCSENDHCAGCNSEQCPDNDWCQNKKCSLEKGITNCFMCEEECKKGLLAKIKPYTFNRFIKKYGLEELLDCLERNEKNGVVYHREGINGDYDYFEDVDELMEFIKTGKRKEEVSELNTEYANVKYIMEDNVVLIQWKKEAHLDDYRTPASFALEQLRTHKNSHFVIDARNGFEDDKRDVEWGFHFLLPEMAKAGCKHVGLIMNEVNSIEEEMDMWTKELRKYFSVHRNVSYEDVICSMK
jgi:hypothetical protein